MKVSVLVPERGRPEQLERLITSLIDTAGEENYEILVFIDEDDPAWRDRSPFDHVRTRYLRRPRPPTLGEKLNQLAQEARGDLLWFIANDMVVETHKWPQRLREAAAELPKGIGVVYAADPTHSGHPSYYALTRQMYETVGFFAPPWFPYWFCDTWMSEIGTLTGLMVQAAVCVDQQEGRGKTHGLIDLPFWVKFFEDTRPMRVRDAIQLMQYVVGDKAPDLSDLDRRHNLCCARTTHLHSPEFLKRWGDTAASPPSDAYPEVKRIAEELLAELEKQKPRRVRIAICVPSGRTWEAPTATCAAAMAAYTAMGGVDVSVLNVQTSIISHSRNKMVETVLAENFDYLFWFDSDMEVPPDTILRLLKHNKDIVGGTYNKRTPREDGTYETLGRMKGPKRDLMGGGLQEADLLPGGVLLVKADVYRKMTKPWYGEAYTWPGETGWDKFKAMMQDYFIQAASVAFLEAIADMRPEPTKDNPEPITLREWANSWAHQGVEFIGEDIWFCRKAARAGFELWCDLDVTFKTKHLGTLAVTCKPEDRPSSLPEAAD